MGSCVILCYLDLFGPERLSKIILVDQPPLVTSDPHWTPQELEEAGATLTAQQVFDTVAALRGKEAEQVTRQIMDGMVTRHATSEMREWIVQCNLKMRPALCWDSIVQSVPYGLTRCHPADQPSHPHHRRSSKRDAVAIARMDSSSNQRFAVRSLRRSRRRPAFYVHRKSREV
jgi:hypothetical protein